MFVCLYTTTTRIIFLYDLCHWSQSTSIDLIISQLRLCINQLLDTDQYYWLTLDIAIIRYAIVWTISGSIAIFDRWQDLWSPSNHNNYMVIDSHSLCCCSCVCMIAWWKCKILRWWFSCRIVTCVAEMD